MPHEWRGHQNVKVSVLNYLKTVVARNFLLEPKFKMHRDIRSTKHKYHISSRINVSIIQKNFHKYDITI